MNNTNSQIIQALDELHAIEASLMRRVMNDRIEAVAPDLVTALRRTHRWLQESVPDSAPARATEAKTQLDLL